MEADVFVHVDKPLEFLQQGLRIRADVVEIKLLGKVELLIVPLIVPRELADKLGTAHKLDGRLLIVILNDSVLYQYFLDVGLRENCLELVLADEHSREILAA